MSQFVTIDASRCRDGYMKVQRSKLMYRVVFPFELKLGCAAAEGCEAADTPYSLFAVIVHVGSGLDHGAGWGLGFGTEIRVAW